jgi:hypothetical protein
VQGITPGKRGIFSVGIPGGRIALPERIIISIIMTDDDDPTSK